VRKDIAMTDHRAPAGHRALLAAARAEFAERGYAGTSIRGIADRAGIATSVLYHYYGSKRELIEAIILAEFDAYLATCSGQLGTVGKDPAERLSALIDTTIRFQVRRGMGVRLARSDRRDLSPDFLGRYATQASEAADLFRAPIEAGIASGQFRVAYPAEARRTIIAMCRAAGDGYEPSGALSVEQVVARHVDLALALLGAASQRPTAA
jgi:AcrR family transcriptional regulator